MLVKRKTTHAVCPNCGFRVETRHHSPVHCDKYRRVGGMRGSGMNDAQVGRELRLSRERVRQILSKAGPEKQIEILGNIVVAEARKLGSDISLRHVMEILEKAVKSSE